MELHWIFVCLVPTLVVCLEKPEDISEEMYCMGCQLVMKELDLSLSRKPTRSVGEAVSRALKQVCHDNNFKKYEMNYKKAMTVCKHIKDDVGMESILVSEYSRIHELGQKSTYLGITQKVCGAHLKACIDVEPLQSGKEGGIEYNPENQSFNIKDGKKVKRAKPVAETRKEDKTPQMEKLPNEIPDLHVVDSHDEL